MKAYVCVKYRLVTIDRRESYTMAVYTIIYYTWLHFYDQQNIWDCDNTFKTLLKYKRSADAGIPTGMPCHAMASTMLHGMAWHPLIDIASTPTSCARHAAPTCVETVSFDLISTNICYIVYVVASIRTTIII